MKKYLLPCDCKKQIEVDSSQSGLKVRCTCGKELEVPTLRGLQQLPVVAADSPATQRRPWGLRQGVWFLAAIVLLITVPAAAFVQLRLKPRVEFRTDHMRAEVQKLSPADSWKMWEMLREGPFVDAEFDEQYQALKARYYRSLGISIGGVVLGVILFIAGFLVSAENRPPRQVSGAPRAGAAAPS